MIVLCSSMTYKEGTVQFLASFADALRANGEDVRIVLEQGVCDDLGGLVPFDHIRFGETLFGAGAHCREVARSIIAMQPSKVVFTDGALGNMVLLHLLGKRVETCLVVHDPEPHPSRLKSSLQERVSLWNHSRWKARSFSMADEYLLLSRTSAGRFEELHPDLCEKVSIMPLCPHPPADKTETVPDELLGKLNPMQPFYLFFGRIDEYKGLHILLRAYEGSKSKVPLVVAGSGALSAEEQAIVAQDEDVYIVNRFIGDREMNWLFSHSLACVLPYVEASQSGVLAMSYHFSKPVIVSNVPGLTEFVKPDETGFVFNDERELAAILHDCSSRRALLMANEIDRFRDAYLDWNQSISDWLHRRGSDLRQRHDG